MVIYVYHKNLFGDITAIYQGSTCVAKYKYDAWGNCTVCNPDGTVNVSADFIGNINPFRYRGYYWDNDLQLYYLQTRYYDPSVCRFISPDSHEYLDPETFGGLNLYTYCLNNPIMYVDPSGAEPITLSLATIAFALICGVAFLAFVASLSNTNGKIIDDGFIGKDNLFNDISDWFKGQKRFISFYLTFAKMIDKYPGQYEEHHIVPRVDGRGEHARYIYEELCGFDINNPINKVYMRKIYHKKLHTNLYFTILDVSLTTAYNAYGRTGVLVTLGLFRIYLGGL